MSVSREETAGRLLALIDRLVADSHAGRMPRSTLDSAFDRDLGLDSLGLVELVTRIEREFGLRLPEETLGEAETPRHLLQALLAAAGHPAAAEGEVAASGPLERTEGVPSAAPDLVQMLDWHVAEHPERLHVTFYRTPEHTETLTYAGLRAAAQAVAEGLKRHGLQSGEAVAIMLPTGLEFFHCFYGILLAGGVPVPIYPPARLSQLEDHLRRQSGILASCLAPLLITVPEAKLVARFLEAQVETLRAVVTPHELSVQSVVTANPGLRAEDTAFIQYTSGSTGNPKGVVLTHANLLANIRAWGRAVQFDSTDVIVSWLPLYHDMGLIGAWLGSLYHACPLVLMSPLDFLARPERWLWAIHRHRGTATAAPNFAYELCLRRLDDSALEGLDLSCWRLAANGAEPVSPDTLSRFAERFAKYGFRPEAMAPVYGLAECTVGLAIPPLGRKPVIDRVRRAPFLRSGLAVAADAEERDALRFVACGVPLPGHQVRIVNVAGQEVPDRVVGRLEFHGPSATSGYFRNPEETQKLFHGEWLDSGDLAYIANGEIYITSRAKDMIIRGGRNLYPYELEEAVGKLAGVRKGCVAIFGVADAGAGTERLVVVAETREREAPVLDALRQRINELSVELLGTPPDDIVLAPPQTVLKTSSGKIRRASTRDFYLSGKIGSHARAGWWQLARVTLTGLTPELRRGLRRAREYGFAAWIWLLFALIAPLVWLAVAATPRPLAWGLCRQVARLFLRISGVPYRIDGLGNIPASAPCILVANHASYIDGIMLMAVLPRAFGLVAKRELVKSFIAHTFLGRLGAQFVERFEVQRGVEDTGRLSALAQGGESLVFFAEGTFSRAPGLMPFRTGAFLVAAEAGVPVVPIAFAGTRSILRDGSWFPRRSPMQVTVSAPIAPRGAEWSNVIALRDEVRAEILRHCGEPDLT
jgi:acyl carrier protein